MPKADAGPRYELHSDKDYARRLDDEDVETWYGKICKAASPRAFARHDKESGPTAGDLIVTKASIHNAARRAYLDLMAGLPPTEADMDALEVEVHEHTHCLVRLLPDGSDHPEDARRYGHPDKAVRGVLHAFGPDCRLGVNAFTGLLRRRPTPRQVLEGVMGIRPLAEPWLQGLQWFGAHLDDKPKPWTPT